MINKKRYMICVKNDDYEVDLDLRKLYPVIPDPKAERLGMIRIVDESGEDYLYPQSFFMAITLPRTVKRALAKAS